VHQSQKFYLDDLNLSLCLIEVFLLIMQRGKICPISYAQRKILMSKSRAKEVGSSDERLRCYPT